VIGVLGIFFVRKTCKKTEGVGLALQAVLLLWMVLPSCKRPPERSRVSTDAGTIAPRPTHGRKGTCVAGSRLTARLTDLFERAERKQPDLLEAYRKLRGYRWKHPDPFSGLKGTAAFGRLIVGFVRGKKHSGAQEKLDRRVEDRLALFLPVPSVQTYRIKLPPGSRYRFTAEAGVIPHRPSGDVTFTIKAAEVVAQRKLSDGQRGRWHPVTADLSRFAGRTVELTVRTDGPQGAGAVLGRPEIWRLNDCRPGPNVIVVLVDTLRADAVQAVSGRWKVTPVMDRMAAGGALFTRCYAAASRTRASLTALLSSEWASRLGFTVDRQRFTRSQKKRVYKKLAPVLGTLKFKRAGYRTAVIGNNRFFLAHGPKGLDRGMDRTTHMEHATADTPAIVGAVERFLERNRHMPFFLWVHLHGPHSPYTPPQGYSVTGARAPGAPRDPTWERFLGEVKWTDEHLARIERAVERLGLAGNTIVLLTGDHGEVFADAHNHWILVHYTRHHHGWSAYDEVLWVPLIMKGPGVAGGVRVDIPVSHLDVMPTVLELAGLKPRPSARGLSLAPFLRRAGMKPPAGGSAFETRPIISEARQQVAVRQGRFKYIHRWDRAARLGRGAKVRVVKHELYDLEKDPLETRNLYHRRPVVAARMERILKKFLKAGRGV
jgi:arylsulfatase A-like enzyme